MGTLPKGSRFFASSTACGCPARLLTQRAAEATERLPSANVPARRIGLPAVALASASITSRGTPSMPIATVARETAPPLEGRRMGTLSVWPAESSEQHSNSIRTDRMPGKTRERATRERGRKRGRELGRGEPRRDVEYEYC
eukprot:scaffold281710_cov33-Tisochrysis_lutea.AAC.1